tara:strand:+ start:858 stop:1250 length:393 start_codon:yes stop_codon:yes gene_type:complete
MAELNQFGLSTLQQWGDGKGWFSYSGLITASTNAKPVILVNNTGQRDSLVTIQFAGSVAVADLNAGTVSNVQIYLGGDIVYQNKISSIDGGNAFNMEVTMFVPKNSTFRIDVTDIDTTGKHSTVVRAHYV